METVESKLEECSIALQEPRQSKQDNFVRNEFPDIEMELMIEGRYNISTTDCFSESYPYYMKDFCVFECPFLYKMKSKFSNITALSDFQKLSKSMQKASAVSPRYPHRIARITSSYGAEPGARFVDVNDTTGQMDTFDLRGDIHRLPLVVARYRYFVVDFQQNTVCAHMLLQLLYFAKRTILLPNTNFGLNSHLEVTPYVLKLEDNVISPTTFSYLYRQDERLRAQSLAAYRFAMNFLFLKRRCTNLRNYYLYLTTQSTSSMVLQQAAPNGQKKIGEGKYKSRRYFVSINRQSASSIAGGKSSGIHIVLSRNNESLEPYAWLSNYSHVIFNRFETVSLPGLHIVNDSRRSNGLESAAYLRYIIDNYDQLPETVLFAQASGSVDYTVEHLQQELEQWSKSMFALRIENIGFGYLGTQCRRLFHSTPRELEEALNGYYSQWLEFPLNRWYNPGSTFVVTKEAIQRRTKESYITLLRLLDYHTNPLEHRLFEITWPAVFRSGCVIGNYDDCMLVRRVDCGVEYDGAVSISIPSN